MEIQSGSIEARNVRDEEIEAHLQKFCDVGEFIKACGASFNIEQRIINNGVASDTTSNGTATGGICTIKDSNTRDTKILIPIANTVQYQLVDESTKDAREEEIKGKDGIGE